MRILPFLYRLSLLLALSPALFAAPGLRFEVIAEQAHDPRLFTQGLVVDGEDFIESSGQYGSSLVRRHAIDNAAIISEYALPKAWFAEGLTLVNHSIYLLTWREQNLIILDKSTLKPQFRLNYEGEGWGLTFDGTHLIMSNGSSSLFYRDSKTFAIKRTLHVKDGGELFGELNELEYAWQAIWANVWRSDKIVRIDPLSGTVTGELMLDKLVAQNGDHYNRVLNGIAYDKQRDALWITGKYWPKRYLIKIITDKP